jgi:hypothetical protein
MSDKKPKQPKKPTAPTIKPERSRIVENTVPRYVAPKASKDKK